MDRVQLSWANVETYNEQQCATNRRRPGRVICEKLACSSGRVIDLSMTGAKLRLRALFSPQKDQMRELSFQTIMGETEIYLCRVMWSRQLGMMRYEIGIEFVDLSDRQKAQLTEIARVHTARTIVDDINNHAA